MALTQPNKPNECEATGCNVSEYRIINGARFGKTGITLTFYKQGNMWLCPDCLKYEQEYQSPEKQAQRLEESRERAKVAQSATETLIAAREIDASIQISQDIFNAKTVAIQELWAAIEADATVENKHFVLAQALDERYKRLVSVITESSEKIKEAQNEQRAIQQYYNELAKKLRAEEREKIKLQDVQYRPPEKKPTVKKAPTVKKYDLGELRKAAGELAKEFPAIPANLITVNLQSIVIQRQISVEDAKAILRGMFGS